MFIHEINSCAFLIWAWVMWNMLNMYSMNWVNTHDVDKKFEYFVSFLRQNRITNKSDVADTMYKIYDKNSIIECELVMYGLYYIVHIAIHDK